MRENVPTDIIRVLSLHGQVQLVAGPPGKEGSIRAECAPYEDVIFLFVRPRAEIVAKTFKHCAAQLYARRDDGEYQLVMRGRAVAGPNVMAHPRRSDLLPWVPEGANPRGFIAVSFFCEELEFTRRERENDRLYQGKTPLGQDAPPMGRRWFKAAFGGVLHVTGLSLALIWAYLLFQGPEYPYRVIALAVATVAILALQAGARLWYRSTAFLRWREGRAHEDEAGQYTTGLMAPEPSRQLSAILTVLGLVLCAALAMWPERLALVTFGVSFAWVQWPLWFLHFSQDAPEPRDMKKRRGA